MEEAHFVTSTGTEIGKTLLSGLLLDLLDDDYDSLGYWKPVASGCEDSEYGYRSPDEIYVIDETPLNPDDVQATFRYDAPLSPDKAASKEDESIEPQKLKTCWQQLRERYDAMVVEGIGGVAVPFNPEYDVSDLANMLDIPVVMVVNSRLGTISHTRTAVNYLYQKNMETDGIILTPETGQNIEKLNRRHLKEFYTETFVGLLPQLDESHGQARNVIKNYRKYFQ